MKTFDRLLAPTPQAVSTGKIRWFLPRLSSESEEPGKPGKKSFPIRHLDGGHFLDKDEKLLVPAIAKCESPQSRR